MCLHTYEILTAWEAGADVIKIFPATKLGPGFIKDLKGPSPQIGYSHGGVTLENTAEFIKAGTAFVGVGSAWWTNLWRWGGIP